MSIQMRRGLLKDFDPSKMLPGEWAVSIDTSTSNQIVWMCFAAGVCKRMGTYEDFKSMIAEATAEIKTEYIDAFNTILLEINSLAEAVESDKEVVLTVKTEITNTYIPQIQKILEDTKTAATNSQTYASNAAKSAEEAKEYELLSKSYAVGETGAREEENTDNAKHYYEESKKIYENFSEAGTVTGVKGSAESSYRSGNVNITKANIGLGNLDDTADKDKPVSEKQQAALNLKLDKNGDASSTTIAFSKATERTNIVSNEKQSVLFGKIKKWFADLTAAAFAQMISTYADMMSNTVSGYLPDALSVKEGFTAVNNTLEAKADESDFVMITGFLENGVVFAVGHGCDTVPHLLSAQIQWEAGVWSDIRFDSTFTNISVSSMQLRLDRSDNASYAGYMVRFLLKK